MKIFLDANILVAVLNKEYPVFTYAARILSLTGKKNIEVFTSPICLAIAFYFAEKKSGTAKAKEKIGLLASKISITETGKKAVQATLKNKSVHDFEDGLEYYSAIHAGCTHIITEDKNDFYFADLPVVTSEEFLKKHFL
jgi:predicted nucleic acid-binding protein